MPVRGTGSRATALQRLRTAMIEKKLTQAELADAADCHEKTVQNLLQGRSVRDQTLFDVCMVLGIDYDRLKRDWAGDGTVEVAEDAPAPARRDSAPRTDFAPLDLGGYTRPAVEHYAGSYVTIRPAFRDGGRPDAAYAHSGRLYIPASSMFLHLVSLTKGAMRMVLLAQMDPLGRMRGLVTTLTRTRGAMFMPVAAPIVYLKSDTIDPADLGELNTGHPRHEEFRSLLVETLDQSYARLQQP
jgi:transcriptional regulator with XRE-family HTH domain